MKRKVVIFMRNGQWIKSTRCSVKDCVEVQHDPGTDGVFVRNSQSRRTVMFSAAEWRAFVEGVKDSEFDV